MDSVQISLRVLGGFTVVIEGTSEELRISSRKACALLAYLAMLPDQRASREHLASFFWGDRNDELARQSLRQCLTSLRGDLAAASVEVLVVDPNTVGLQSKIVAVDAVEFLELADSSKVSDLDRAAGIYRGEFLADFYLDETFDAWVCKTRNQVDSAAARLFETHAKLADAEGEGEQAIQAVERLIRFDPLREDWQRLAVQIYARYRGREQAIVHADEFVMLLKTKLGVEPEPATKIAIDEIRRQDASLVPPQDSQPNRDTTVPTGRVEVLNPSFADAANATPDAKPSGALASVVARAWRRTTHWSLGTMSSIVIAGLISVAAIGLMIGSLKSPSQLGIPVANISDAEVAGRHTAANAIKRVIKPLAVPPGIVPIVVLPFTADDNDGPNQRAADSLTDDVINALSRFAVTRLISRQTAFTYKGRPVDVAEVGAELGVRYAVEGSFRVTGTKNAVNFQLVDTTDRLQILSDHVEWDESDRTVFQGEIATRIARELKTGVTIAVGERSADRQAQLSDVDALVMQGWAWYYRAPSRENLAKQLALFEAALRRDPDLQQALVGAALVLINGVLNSLADDPEANLNRASELLDHAFDMAPNSYRVHFGKGMIYEARGDYDAALRSFSKCVDINPSATIADAQIAEILTRLGRPQQGVDRIQYAMRLSPKDPAIGTFYAIAGEAELELKHDDAAAGWFQRAIASQPRNPTAYLYLAATYALMGDRQNAATYWSEFRIRSAPAAIDQLVRRLRADPAAQPLRSRLDAGLRMASAS
jgi:DNA-binding SARP family transcriptional activator/TolB-like protein/Tfp pilus assembly protein PilF